MAQAMCTNNFCSLASPLKNKHRSLYSHLFFSPLPQKFPSPSSSSTLSISALFKSKTKATPPKKVVLEKPKRRVADDIVRTSGGIGFATRNANDLEEEEEEELRDWITAPNLIATALAFCLTFCSAANGQEGGGALFNRACIGCHVGGGNVIQAGATLFSDDLERNGVGTEDEIYGITYSGKGRMPGFGEKCTPRGQCTFGPRLTDEEIRLLAQFVKLQAQQGWPKTE